MHSKFFSLREGRRIFTMMNTLGWSWSLRHSIELILDVKRSVLEVDSIHPWSCGKWLLLKPWILVGPCTKKGLDLNSFEKTSKQDWNVKESKRNGGILGMDTRCQWWLYAEFVTCQGGEELVGDQHAMGSLELDLHAKERACFGTFLLGMEEHSTRLSNIHSFTN